MAVSVVAEDRAYLDKSLRQIILVVGFIGYFLRGKPNFQVEAAKVCLFPRCERVIWGNSNCICQGPPSPIPMCGGESSKSLRETLNWSNRNYKQIITYDILLFPEVEWRNGNSNAALAIEGVH